MRAWQGDDGGPLSFSPSNYARNMVQIPCSQCIGCRLERSRQWATRCMHESAMHEENSFITLTYDQENIPWDGSLNKKHLQDFFKRFRHHLGNTKIRYYAVGEYGDQLMRPHYHALIFGYDFPDRELWTDREGVRTYVSEQLSKIWKWGFTTVGDCTWETAAYCARYALKKQTGKNKDHYWVPLTSDMHVQLQPEFAVMSLKPAIGKRWFEEFEGDCYPSDYITQKGKKLRVPKYYDELLAAKNPELLAEIKERRKRQAWKHNEDNTPQRLEAKEACTKARMNLLRRGLEE